jgi:hypothetical protein
MYVGTAIITYFYKLCFPRKLRPKTVSWNRLQDDHPAFIRRESVIMSRNDPYVTDMDARNGNLVPKESRMWLELPSPEGPGDDFMNPRFLPENFSNRFFKLEFWINLNCHPTISD